MRIEIPRNLFARALRRLVRPIGLLEIGLIYRKNLTGPLGTFRARLPVEIAEAATDEIEDVVAIADVDPAEMRARPIGAYRCFVARHEGKIVGYNWIGFGEVRESVLALSLRPDDVFCLDAYTLPAYRGNAIHTQLLHHMLVFAQSAGYRTAYTLVHAHNHRSWKTHLRLGWEEVGSVLVFQPRKLGRPQLWRQSGSQYPIDKVL